MSRKRSGESRAYRKTRGRAQELKHRICAYRWIPYSEQDLASTEYVDLLNVTSPPPEKLASAPPPFNDWIKSAVDLKQAPELDFARGKTILTVGDR